MDKRACAVIVRAGTRRGSVLMISDWELWVCARQQIEHYGGEAAVAAAMRADALLADGDLDGQRTWLAILQRIDRLTSVGANEVQH